MGVVRSEQPRKYSSISDGDKTGNYVLSTSEMLCYTSTRGTETEEWNTVYYWRRQNSELCVVYFLLYQHKRN